MGNQQGRAVVGARQETPSPEVDLAELLCGSRHMMIRHGDRLYVLRLTRQNRLILTRAEGEQIVATTSASKAHDE